MRSHWLAGASTVLVLAAYGQAWAQGAAQSDGTIEEIVVTARKRAESLQDAPISITAMTAESMERAGVENVTEENMPEAHIRGDIDTPYRCIGGAVFTMQRAGFARVGFISEPPAGGITTRL